MARAQLATQDITAAGLTAAYTAAAADGHMIDGDAILHVKNASAASANVTLQTPAQSGGLDIAERVVAVAAGTEKFIGHLDPGTYQQPSGADEGKIYVDISAIASVTLAAVK